MSVLVRVTDESFGAVTISRNFSANNILLSISTSPTSYFRDKCLWGRPSDMESSKAKDGEKLRVVVATNNVEEDAESIGVCMERDIVETQNRV